MNFIRKNYRIIIFGFILFVRLFILNVIFYEYDATWEYGFCHAFVIGETPYVDFNIISTPLFIFLFSLGLFIKDSFIVFLIESFILNIVVFYFVDKIIKNKSIIYICTLCGAFFYALIPTYNYLAFSIVILLLCFEKLEYSDKLIGFFWGLLILSKHTIGLPIVFIVLVGLLIKKVELKKVVYRILYMFIPLLLFFAYLVLSKSLFAFFDLSIAGLFEFASKNSKISIYFLVSLIILIYTSYILIKQKNNILIYYLLGSFMFVLPLFDKSHISFYLMILIFVFLCNNNSKLPTYGFIYFWLFIFMATSFVYYYSIYDKLVFSKANHYEYLLMDSDFEKSINEVHKKLSKYEKYYMIDGLNMYYDIVYDREITYYDVPLYGNFGYNGSKKFVDMIKNEKDCYFVITNNEKRLNPGDQFNHEAYNYIKNNFLKVDSIGGFSVYYKE